MERTSTHYAVLYTARGQLIGAAFNAPGSRSRGCGPSERTWHAEMKVLAGLKDKSQLEGCTLAVTRFTACGDMVESKPCYECHTKLVRVMEKYGLKGGTVHVRRIQFSLSL